MPSAPHNSQSTSAPGDDPTSDVSDDSKVENAAQTRSAAQTQFAASRRPGARPSPVEAVLQRAALLEDAYEFFNQRSEDEPLLSPAAEWLLDNFYLVQQALRQIREDLPDQYYGELPKLDEGPLKDYPRVYALMRQAVKDDDALVDIAHVASLVQRYQEIPETSEVSLTMGELWAIPTMLRTVLLELLTDAIASVTHLSVSKHQAGHVPDPLILNEDVSQDTIAAHCIRSLRTVGTQDWEDFFEQVSRVEAELREDPADVYRRMTFKSRDQYRKVVEVLALKSGRTEIDVARRAVALAAGISSVTDRQAHVGYYLLDGGRRQLEAVLDCCYGFGERLRRWSSDHALPIYLGAIALLTLLVMAALVAYAALAGGTWWLLVITAILTLVPASVLVVNSVNAFVTRVVGPSMLPKLDFGDGIPDDSKTVVVIPGMLTAPDEVDFLIAQLERHYLSNATIVPSPNLRFALLTDFADAPQEHMPDDEALLARAKAGIEGLNRRYGSPASFCLLHRSRRWNSKEETWMGWERKRGKLMEFNRLILGEGETTYTTQVGDVESLKGSRYVITLDADTVMPQDSTHRLIATLAHPLNRAEFDEETGRVTAGYTVLQPRTEVKPTSVNATPFTHTFAGDAGLDLYTLAVSDVYQDLFDEGIFVGKGIYDVAAFYQSLEGRVPENALLSHDLFEGIHGRAGLVTDIVLYEDYPPSYLTYAHRQHRWVRGDWQLLPWLFPRVPALLAPPADVALDGDQAIRDGSRPSRLGTQSQSGKIRNRLSALDRWKIVDNLRRSLRTPALVVLFLAGWLFLPGRPWLWTLVTVLISATPVLTGLLTALTRVDPDQGVGHALSHVKIEAMRWLFSLTFLLYEAVLFIDAIVVTLVRLFITHRGLLQWVTAAHALRDISAADNEAAQAGGSASEGAPSEAPSPSEALGQAQRRRAALTLRRMLVAPVFALVFGAAVVLVAPRALPPAIPLLLLWIVSPRVAFWISTPVATDQEPLTGLQRNKLRRLARRTWLYFERFVGPEDHWLPPDHFQEDPRGLAAHSTSPTNIGLTLVSTLSAYDLGYVGPLTLVLRLRSTFDSMEQLERYRGHFLNWYETRDLGTLDPRYVSTVDSGNLVAALLTLKEGLRSIPQEPVLRWERWEGLRDTLGILTEILEFAGLTSASETVDAARRPDLRGTRSVEFQEVVGALEAHLARIRRHVRAVRETPERLPTMLEDLSNEGLSELRRLMTTLLEDGVHVLHVDTLRGLRLWSERLYYHLRNMREEMDLLVPWLLPVQSPPAFLVQAAPESELGKAWRAALAALPPAPQLEEIPEICREGQDGIGRVLALLDDEEPTQGSGPSRTGDDDARRSAREWCTDLMQKLDQARQRSRSLLIGIRGLADQAESLGNEMDFSFLFDPQREVFFLGYRVDEEQLDTNHYDLLASEARTASLIAIAKGDVPQSHWLHLARPLAEVAGMRALLSWNGSMFEYLMPDLFSRSYESTLLTQTNRAVVQRQISYGRDKGVPWGISESGYYRFDAARNYQYQGFGVPGIGRKRGLGEDLVITPYASLLATAVAPQAVLENVDALIDLGMMGHYGFYEAADFTSARLPLGRDHAIVKSYMVHHQGMILLALTNVLRGNVHVERFHADPRIQTVDLLLQERIPTDVPVEETPEETSGAERESTEPVALAPWTPATGTPLPQVHYLSNGDYGVLITAGGSGYSHWRDLALTRWRADTTRDLWGTWIYVQDLESGDLWSLTDHPIAPAGTACQVRFYPHQAEFSRHTDDLLFRLDIAVAPDDPVEMRRVVITNHAATPHHLRLTSYGEVVLAAQNADRRHPAFNKMFIESEYVPDVATALSSSPSTQGGERQGRMPALIFRRRQREPGEVPHFLGHALVVDDALQTAKTLQTAGAPQKTGSPTATTYETDRARFLGRGRTCRAPQALEPDSSAKTLDSESPAARSGSTLDPIMSLGQEIIVAPRATVTLVYLTVAVDGAPRMADAPQMAEAPQTMEAPSSQSGPMGEEQASDDAPVGIGVSASDGVRTAVLNLLAQYRTLERIERAFETGRSQSEAELRNLGLDGHDLGDLQLVLSALLYPYPAMRAEPDVLAANRMGQSGLWPYAISGDYPILLVRVKQQEELPLVREVMRAHTYWRHRGLMIDVVLLNEKDVGYEQELNQQLMRVLRLSGSDTRVNTRGGVFIVTAGQLNQSSRALLLSAARVVLSGEAGTFSAQVQALKRQRTWLPALVPSEAPQEQARPGVLPPLTRPESLHFDNGYGGFTEDGRAYVIYLDPSRDTELPQATPAPWVNVIANEDFGFIVSESGGGNTWAINSGENRLTPWRNDPVSDPPAEALYLRDEASAEVWTPTPQPAGEALPYLIRHEAGRTTFSHHSHGLIQELQLFAAPDAPVKIIRLRLENVSERPRRITATYYAAWVLGVDRDTMQQYVVSAYDDETGALLARNAYNAEFGDRVAFLASDRRPHGMTADRTEFLGRSGDLGHPAALGRIGLSGNIAPGSDPCGAIQVHLDLETGAATEVIFLLGQGSDRDDALALVKRFQNGAEVAAASDAVTAFWDGVLDTITVDTPDETMNVALRWALYEALSCRVWGRSALYQSSGAFGFRDQLQDVMSLLHARPDLTRAHILRAAAHQFEAGDVLHWWHPPSGRGVRTRISDDLLWLPYVTAEYVMTTGDETILDERVSFLKGAALKSGEDERYGHYDSTEDTYTLYEHCLRALEKGTTSGPHGLPLMGAGDWNDGMNRVGIGGRGESIWLGWFLYATSIRFADLCEQRGDAAQAESLRTHANELREALEAHGWDGQWYRRAYYDDGTPLGSTQNEACKIDSLAQSWAVLSGAGDPERVKQAMASVDERLVRRDDHLLALFTPPFVASTPIPTGASSEAHTPSEAQRPSEAHDPGYIKGYPPGIRENGGQYTHAAIWAVWAFAELGQGDRAEALFRMLNPINHGRSREVVDRYRVEPYVVAADVYGEPPFIGRGGWTWYTGSSGWYYRLGVEAILGIHREGMRLRIDPVIPHDWGQFGLTYRFGESVYRINVINPDGVNRGVVSVELDGEALSEPVVPMVDDGDDHEVHVRMGAGPDKG